MAYYISTKLPLPFAGALERTESALKDADACNPQLAFEALKLEDKVGTMLPCNVVVQELSPETVEIAAIDPVEWMQAIRNPDLLERAQEVKRGLARLVESLTLEHQPA